MIPATHPQSQQPAAKLPPFHTAPTTPPPPHQSAMHPLPPRAAILPHLLYLGTLLQGSSRQLPLPLLLRRRRGEQLLPLQQLLHRAGKHGEGLGARTLPSFIHPFPFFKRPLTPTALYVMRCVSGFSPSPSAVLQLDHLPDRPVQSYTLWAAAHDINIHE